jgi:hypothetical protein
MPKHDSGKTLRSLGSGLAHGSQNPPVRGQVLGTGSVHTLLLPLRSGQQHPLGHTDSVTSHQVPAIYPRPELPDGRVPAE